MLIAMPKKGKTSDDDDEAPVVADEGGEESDAEEFASMAFDSMRDGDKMGFKQALLGMVKACMSKYDA